MIDRQAAIDIARAASQGVLEVPLNAPVEVEEADDALVVSFLAQNPPGVRGPDFHARVRLDAESGEVLEIVAGS